MEGEARQLRIRWKRSQLEEELSEKVQRLTLREEVEDKWEWSRNSYSVKEAYTSIVDGVSINFAGELATVWSHLIPLKVSVLMWRMLQNRILTKDNLARRDVLNGGDISCSFGCGEEENVSHVFFECRIAAELWREILKWTNFSTALHNTVSMNFHQFEGLIGARSVRAERFRVIWFASIWIIWKGRNEKTFRNKNGSAEAWLEDIKLLSWKWLTSKVPWFNYSQPMDFKCLHT